MCRQDTTPGSWRWMAFAAMVGCLGLAVGNAQAVPSMGRQTGYQCSRCHTVFPELTPFGREFKLGGFSQVANNWDRRPWYEKVPVSALLQVSRTETENKNTDGAVPDAFPRDRQAIIQAGGFYYGGRIYDNLGALIQYNYDGFERKWGMEMFDLRYGSDAAVADKNLAWGVSMNNSPTLSDIYSSTPMWGFPHTESATLQPAGSTMIDMMLASQVGGVAAYGLWDDRLYAEFGGYGTAQTGFFRFMALGDRPVENRLRGTAPYWRVAWQGREGPHSYELGAYGLTSRVYADAEDLSLGTDRFNDLALDGQYQYITDQHQSSLHVTWIYEKQHWDSSFDQGMSSAPSTVLKTFRADAHYYFKRMIGGAVQYFQTRGDANDLRYNTGEPVTGSANGSPNSKGWIGEIAFLPTKAIKLAVRYTAYQQFNGAKDNYDGFGRRARDNNSVFLLLWWLT